MKVDIFTLCDAAQDYNGKMSILGAFSVISTRKIPAVHPEMAIAAKINFGADNSADEHMFTFTIVAEDGTTNLIAPMRATLNASQLKGNFYTSNLVIKLNNVNIPMAGMYTATLNIDGQEFKTNLLVKLVEEK